MSKQRSAVARFLMAVADNTADPAVLVDFDGTNHTSTDWLENVRVTDEDGNFTASKVDTTDREAARAGFETEEVTTSKAEISFTMFNDPSDPHVDYFVNAWVNKTTVPAWSADGDPEAASTSRPVAGVLANWSVELRPSRPVKGMQTWAVTLTASSQPLYYKITTALAAGTVV